MKIKIDALDIGVGVLIACWGASSVISAIGERDVKLECMRHGGNIVTVLGSGFAKDRICQAPQVKP